MILVIQFITQFYIKKKINKVILIFVIKIIYIYKITSYYLHRLFIYNKCSQILIIQLNTMY
jgi:hypothetical protein